MRTALLLPLLLVSAVCALHATTWRVGPSRAYTAPGKVAALVADGDTVAIDAGTYEADVARWSANNLVLMGVDGFAHLKANGTAYGGKAIWVIAGNNTTVEHIEFSLCRVPDKNGAGIRQEGANLTVRRCFFHNNEDGILAGDNAASDILIENTEFADNGFGDGLSHNLYINHVKSLTFRYNYSHGALVGHELKSRAHRTYILYNRLADGSEGTASRSIDLPNGGTAIIIGNEIQQGPKSENSNIIGYGLEGLSNPTAHHLVLVNNTIVNEKGNGSFVNVKDGTALCRMYNNLFAGPGAVLAGTAAVLDSAGNLKPGIPAAGFANAAAYDYTLTATSPAIDGAMSPTDEDGFPLTPTLEYVHPFESMPRTVNGSLDIGAHERSAQSGMASRRPAAQMLEIAPNPTLASAVARMYGAGRAGTLTLYDMRGRAVWRGTMEDGESVAIEPGGLAAGTYTARYVSDDGTLTAVRRLVVR